ncbi:MAG: folate-binding protein, partial [Pseudolabrys sp.]|nr:folate-binding protein [Pseudolabrys sp.]
MQAAVLPDRGVIKVAGDDSRRFLNGLLTADIEHLSPGIARYTALLTPQGKIIVDFVIVEATPQDGGGFFLDCPRVLVPALVEKLNFYKLRAKVTIEDLSDRLAVMAVWGGDARDSEYGLSYCDPRLPAVGMRIILPPDVAEDAARDLLAEFTDEAAFD